MRRVLCAQQRTCRKVDEDFFKNVDKLYYTNYLHYLGGCYGNGNRFETKEFCENACPYGSRRIMGPGRPKRPGPQGSLVNICNLPRDLGKYVLENLQQSTKHLPTSIQFQFESVYFSSRLLQTKVFDEKNLVVF